MKIWGIQQVSGVYDKSKTAAKVGKTTGMAGKRDEILISDKGKDFQSALKAAREAPDIRASKVEDIKQRMQTDTYEVSGDDVADKVINSILEKKI
jgi:negative regulator of flagellin synthesis FlgM